MNKYSEKMQAIPKTEEELNQIMATLENLGIKSYGNKKPRPNYATTIAGKIGTFAISTISGSRAFGFVGSEAVSPEFQVSVEEFCQKI